jgi:hypothetical protein
MQGNFIKRFCTNVCYEIFLLWLGNDKELRLKVLDVLRADVYMIAHAIGEKPVIRRLN